jgi:hypothetical protein
MALNFGGVMLWGGGGGQKKNLKKILKIYLSIK